MSQTPPGQPRQRQVFYAGPKDPRIEHEPWCRVPHPNAVMTCMCPASASLGYGTSLREMSVDQYDVLYKPAPMPRHKLKAIRHKRHLQQPDNRSYWPKDRKGKPYDPRRYGYPSNWLEDRYDREVVLGDVDDNPNSGNVQPSPVSRALAIPDPAPGAGPTPDAPPTMDAYRVGRNYWEAPVDPQSAQRWHTDPSYNPPEYTPEQLDRARRRAATQRRQPPPDIYPNPESNNSSGVVPTALSRLSPEAQRQAYPPTGQPMTPHTQQRCRAPLIVDLPGSTIPSVIECECEPEHPNAPHMARITGRRPSQVIYMTWVDDVG